MTQRHKPNISEDYKQGQKRCQYKTMESICKNDGNFCFSNRIEDWMFSRIRKHKNYPNLF